MSAVCTNFLSVKAEWDLKNKTNQEIHLHDHIFYPNKNLKKTKILCIYNHNF